MLNTIPHTFDIGDLKNDPERLYALAIGFHQFYPGFDPDDTTELGQVLAAVDRSLWGNLPPVLVVDFRDPDDPNTWGSFGAPVGAYAMKPHDKQPPKLYTVQELATHFSVSKSTVSRWIKRGVLSATQIGGRYYIEEQALTSAIKSGKIAPSCG